MIANELYFLHSLEIIKSITFICEQKLSDILPQKMSLVFLRRACSSFGIWGFLLQMLWVYDCLAPHNTCLDISGEPLNHETIINHCGRMIEVLARNDRTGIIIIIKWGMWNISGKRWKWSFRAQVSSSIGQCMVGNWMYSLIRVWGEAASLPFHMLPTGEKHFCRHMTLAAERRSTKWLWLHVAYLSMAIWLVIINTQTTTSDCAEYSVFCLALLRSCNLGLHLEAASPTCDQWIIHNKFYGIFFFY